MKILITGIAGFVGKHLVRYLVKDKDNEILGIDLKLDNFSIDNFIAGELQSKIKVLEVDIKDKKSVEDTIKKFKPQQIYHLAAQSSVNFSWENPIETFRINVFGGINILESIKNYCPACKILVVCTAEEYGKMDEERKAINEDFKIYPSNPYAISKSALDFFSTTFSINLFNLIICFSIRKSSLAFFIFSLTFFIFSFFNFFPKSFRFLSLKENTILYLSPIFL